MPELTHLTFDFAQPVELPYHFRQMGPLYFKDVFRCQLFGKSDTGRKGQTNYMFHEGVCIGAGGKHAHGPNAVVSILTKLPRNERSFHLHADSCFGQNKNKTVLAYLSWFVGNKIFDSVELSFMKVGHTRCVGDGRFGLINQKFRTSVVDTADDLEDVVNFSCSPNVAQRFTWSWREWDSNLSESFLPLWGITQYQHFRFSASDEKGTVWVREVCDGPEFKKNLLKANAGVPAGRPAILAPGGSWQQRCSYLNKEVLPYLTQGKEATWAYKTSCICNKRR